MAAIATNTDDIPVELHARVAGVFQRGHYLKAASLEHGSFFIFTPAFFTCRPLAWPQKNHAIILTVHLSSRKIVGARMHA